MYDFEFLSLTQLGQNFGVSNQKVGKWLIDISLRDQHRQPTKLAWDELYCRTHTNEDGNSFVVWDRIKTTKRLIEAGYKEVGNLDSDESNSRKNQTPSGPFLIGFERDGSFPLLDSTGNELAYFGDGHFGRRTARLLTMVDEKGLL